jgi:hypothetical protein
MSQGNDFANYTPAIDGNGASEEVWFVAVAADDIKQMNVDQLDEAFRLGVITGATAVWTEGMEAWAPLGQVVDLDGEDGSAQDERASAVAPVASTHLQNGHVSSSHGASNPITGNSYAAVTLQSVQHSFAPGPNSMAPVTSSYAPSAHLGLSTSPVALNVDEDMPPVRHGRRFRPERWALGAAALIAIGVVGYNNLFSSSASAGTQAPAPTALAARPYDGADGVDRGETVKASSKEEVTADPAPSHAASSKPSVTEAVTGAVPPVAKDSESADDEPPASSKSKAADKESLKGSFNKAFGKDKDAKETAKERRAAAKASKVKPRKAAARASTKSRATKASKKPGVARTQSAFDPLNDSLP